jgi:hypothetical protein
MASAAPLRWRSQRWLELYTIAAQDPIFTTTRETHVRSIWCNAGSGSVSSAVGEWIKCSPQKDRQAPSVRDRGWSILEAAQRERRRFSVIRFSKSEALKLFWSISQTRR